MNLIDAIYTRQSVDRADSISVESQAEFCKREVADANTKVYTDKGYSGKNIDRPAFQEMLADIECGKIRRVIVYRLDRISRSVLDFANIIEVFQRYNVDFVSTMEKFDTGTPIGKAMLMIVMIFAQLERETIQLRVLDAYHSRSKRGFYMGGKVPYGFRLTETVIDGIRTKMYEQIPEEAEIVRKIFSMYAEPQTSFGDIARYLGEQQVKKRDGGPFTRPRLRDLVVNPVYVRADYRIYEFFKSQGANIINTPEEFIGTNGAYLYSGEEANKRKTVSLQGHTLVLAPHEGIVNGGIWIKCRSKCLNNNRVAKPVKAKVTWLAGKIRCAQCGYALSAKTYHCKTKEDNRYFLCAHKYDTGVCHFGSLNADFLEETVFKELCKKLTKFQTLSKQRQENFDLHTINLKSRIEKIEQEISSLLDKVAQANESVMEYINSRVAALDAEKKKLNAEVVHLSKTGGESLEKISGYLDYWALLTISDKITVVDSLIENIYASQEEIKIKWKI
ncbi:recombinase family protein [Flavonifractor sp. HCP28S3_F3]|uniref:recombinase family protein n=1 Tax=Flavonifractor sp. HCP28S3_F3 TaxID=3438939 RepID=UPI003F8978ED